MSIQSIYTAESIEKRYTKSKFSLELAALNLDANSITGVVGENGNGKTTLLEVIAGNRTANGNFTYFGEPVSYTTSWSEVKSKIAFIPQRIPKWYGTLRQNLSLKATLDGYKDNANDDEVNKVLSFLKLKDKDHLTWGEISTGYRLRFELARVLIGNPKLLILDEPLANLDINTQQQFLHDLKRLLSDREDDLAVILSSQQLHEIESIADQMLFLKDGKLLFSGDQTKLRSEGGLQFELQVEDEIHFTELLETLAISYQKRGAYFQITVSEEAYNTSSLLLQLLNQGVTVRYFRDISGSTKKLF